ncbi:MAG: hypothetical protein JO297_17190 [Nitrososphaeraceae archaeon]|nr:hypothetical protein [Nitrososphaeraceae archaeon]
MHYTNTNSRVINQIEITKRVYSCVRLQHILARRSSRRIRNIQDKEIEKHLNLMAYVIASTISKMTGFNDYYYYLKTIRWILNNSLAEISFLSSSSTMAHDIQKERKNLDEEKIKYAIDQDLEKWSEYKVKRLAEEVRMN